MRLAAFWRRLTLSVSQEWHVRGQIYRLCDDRESEDQSICVPDQLESSSGTPPSTSIARLKCFIRKCRYQWSKEPNARFLARVSRIASANFDKMSGRASSGTGFTAAVQISSEASRSTEIAALRPRYAT
jgi:hypothetical protein